MRRWMLWALGWVLALGQGMAVLSQDNISTEVIQIVNEARRAAGIDPLWVNAALVQAAQRHSDDMAQSGQLTHVGSDGSQFWERAARAGYTLSNGAENVLSRYDTLARGVFDQWRASAAHNANMMNAAYQEVGLAWSIASDSQVYFTMILGSRADFVPPTATRSAPVIVIPSATPFVMLPTATPLGTDIAPLVTSTATIVADSRIATLMAPLPTNTLNPILLTPVPTRVPIQPPARPSASVATAATPTPGQRTDLRMVYSEQSFTLFNKADRPLWMAGLSFISASGRFDADSWGVNMEDVSPGRCFMVWGLEAPTIYSPLEGCTRLAWSAVNDSADFWRDAESFRVERYGDLLGECRVSSGLCELSLTPGENAAGGGTDNSVAEANSSNQGGGIRLIRDEFGLALINLSGRVQDLSNLAFESESGVFLASQWNIPNLTRELSSYPNGDCLQVWGVGSVDLPKPGGCRYRHAWVVVPEEAQFWRSSEYRVRLGNQLIASCVMDVCEFNLP